MKSVRYQKRKHKKSKWMTTGILNSINTKDRLYKTLLKTDTSSNAYRVAKANFKRYREILRNSIKRAKMLYYKKTFNLYQNDVKKTWALIKETLQQKKKHELPTEFIWNDRIITDLDEIANKFNTYFINIGHSLSEQIHATRSSDEYLSNRPISQTVFMLSIAINRAEHACATVIIKHNYMLMCNHKFVINIMLCLLNSTGHI